MTLPRSFATLRLLFVVALVAVAAPLVTAPSADAAPAASAGKGSSSATTIKGKWRPWKPNATLVHDPDNFDYWTGAFSGRTPSVTVSQTTNLADQVVNVSWRNFTPSSNESLYADTSSDSGGPNAVPYRADDTTLQYGVNIYQCRGTNPKQNPADNFEHPTTADCYEYSTDNPNDGPGGVNNAVRSVTQNNGTGYAQVHVENRINLPTLNCSSRQACSLVVVPNNGGRFTSQGSDTSQCNDHSADILTPYEFDINAGVQGRLSACSWANRVVFPLHFRPIAENCSTRNISFTAAGSPPMQTALNQLIAGWCRGSRPLNFNYNFSVTEENAKQQFLSSTSSGFTSATDVALTSRPAAAGAERQRPFKYAPIANNAVAFPYLIDNLRTGRPITDLRLNARLVAKLLTQSYAPLPYNCPIQEMQTSNPAWCAQDIRNNPQTIFDDPEFQRLNFRGDHPDRESFPQTGAGLPGSQVNSGSFFPTVTSGDSDETYALTRWIASDPDGNDFMRGRADPWGARVNPYYRVKGGSLYPTTRFDALDPGFTAPNVAPRDPSERDLRLNQGLQGVWNPVGGDSLIALSILRGRATATQPTGLCLDKTGVLNTCDSTKSALTVRFQRIDPEAVGFRGLTAVMNNAEARADALPTAQLITAKGTFVAPTASSLATGVAAMRTNADGVTQSLDFDSAPKAAYPVLLPVYAMVPTCGLTSVKAAGIKDMLGRVVSSQTYGDAPGTLARGLAKLTSQQVADTRAAAASVSTKKCPTPPPTTAPTGSKNNGGNSGGNNSGGNGGAATNGPAAADAPTATPSTAVRNNSASSSTTPSPQPKALNAGYQLHDGGSGLSLLPILLLLGALALIGGPLGWWALATAPGRSARDRLRHLIVGAGGWRR